MPQKERQERKKKEGQKEGRKEGMKEALSLSLPNQGFSNGTPWPKQHLSVAAWHVAALFISAIASKGASNH
jgi:hypothetical protein